MTKIEQLQAIKDSVAEVAGEVILEAAQFKWLCDQVEASTPKAKTSSGALLNWVPSNDASDVRNGIYVTKEGVTAYSEMPKSTHKKSAVSSFIAQFGREHGQPLEVVIIKGGKEVSRETL